MPAERAAVAAEQAGGSALDRGFAAEERRGLQLAVRARLAALIAVQAWLLWALPEHYTLYYHGLIGTLLVLGLVQASLLGSRHHRTWQNFLFAGLDGVLLAMILLLPNPLLPDQPPAAMWLRYSNVLFFFVLLAGVALSYSPSLVCWSGLSAMAAWVGFLALLLRRDGVVTSRDPIWAEAATMDDAIVVFMRPDFVDLNLEIKKVFIVLLVTALLALVVRRARRLARNQVSAERARTNLARYFSPNLVERLAGQDQPLGEVRRQSVAVLFADVVGFTAMCEQLPPEDVVLMLRGFHQRMEAAVFAADGTLDKYMGDGLMATFGTPAPGPADATAALACARQMLVELDRFNSERAGRGEPPIAIGIGLHYGPVVQGDIGGGQRLEFTVLGDTVNIAARLEALTRKLGTALVVSQDLIDRASEESDQLDLSGLVPGESQPIRGRVGALPVWTLAG